MKFNPQLDLRLVRTVPVSRADVWRAWTEPERLKPWFCPRPWTTIDCEIDLQPGGVFRTTMQSPEGQLFPNRGCYLAVETHQRLVWTNALSAGFRPSLLTETCGSDEAGFMFTAIIELADDPQGTLYTATVKHADVKGCQTHAAMGFEQGWGIALDQMVAMIQSSDRV
jgi:uncharacterized protein YndB with AHSA1/START domain